MKIRDFALTLIASGAMVATGVPAQTTDTSSTSSTTSSDDNGTTTTTTTKKHHKKHARRSSAKDDTTKNSAANDTSTKANDQQGIPAGNPSQSGLSPDRKTTDEHGNTRVTGTDAMNTSSHVKVSNDNDTGQQGASSGVSGPTSTPANTPSGSNNGSQPAGGGPNSQDSGAKPRK
ncbi:MAG TPA: hypothetical protein VI356_20570 [Myxococcales bacterium]